MEITANRGFRGLACIGIAAGILGLAALLPTDANALTQTLTASDGGVNHRFGADVAVDGDTAVVGAQNANGLAGAAYVFTRTGDSWVQTAELTAPGTGTTGLGFRVGIDGDTIVASSAFTNNGAGAIFTFTRTGAANRTHTAMLTASDAEQTSGGDAGTQLGFRLAIDGDRIVAGAPGADVLGAQDAGAVYVFSTTGATPRTELHRSVYSAAVTDSAMGTSVDLDGDLIVAGAPADGFNVAGEGAAYIFPTAGGAETTALDASAGATGDALGVSVGIEGDTIVVGAAGASSDRGRVYLFPREAPGVVRQETAELVASDGAAGDDLGAPVAIDDRIVVGASGDAGDAGAAYEFARAGATPRNELRKLTHEAGAADDEFGTGVATSGSTIIAGAWLDTVGTNDNQGSARIFFEPDPPNVKITKVKRKKRRAKIRFEADEADVAFRCKLDRKPERPCTSPVKYRNLKPGRHRVSVTGTDVDENVDPTPVTKRFRVKRPR